MDEYEDGDPRLANIYMEGDMYYTMNDQRRSVPLTRLVIHRLYHKKYRGERNVKPENHAPNGQADFTNERWYRYAEMLLLYAEALIENGRSPEAMDIINNEIRPALAWAPPQ